METRRDLDTAGSSSVALTDVRDNIKAIIDEVVNTATEYTVTRHGKPVAVILSYEEYESLVETLNILSDDDAMDAIEEAEAELNG
ncbi:type II toxin-antitoxin system Phd/YefM family antitoxin [Mycolicibacterium litorale]|uniref:type II toxin-antitoxin system Phd/YefM family antitoxin n=1 Tax=Mycolicibacterium litorale TaxID=758802 RepID=UPI003CEFAC26